MGCQPIHRGRDEIVLDDVGVKLHPLDLAGISARGDGLPEVLDEAEVDLARGQMNRAWPNVATGVRRPMPRKTSDTGAGSRTRMSCVAGWDRLAMKVATGAGVRNWPSSARCFAARKRPASSR